MFKEKEQNIWGGGGKGKKNKYEKFILKMFEKDQTNPELEKVTVIFPHDKI